MEQHIEPPGPATTRRKRTLFKRPLVRNWTLGVGALVAAFPTVAVVALSFADSQGVETPFLMLVLNVAIVFTLGAGTGLIVALILAAARLLVTRQRPA
jgi:hypothetical protein